MIDAAATASISWLLESEDPALLHQVRRDLSGRPRSETDALREQMMHSGWAASLFEHQNEDWGWDRGIYSRKWTCTHYVLWELLQLDVPPWPDRLHHAVDLLFRQPTGADGGINYAKTVRYSDLCINGMILAIACHVYRSTTGEALRLLPVTDYLLAHEMADGGWNCEYLHGAVHGSLHTTIGVLEGLFRLLRAVETHGEELRRILGHRVELASRAADRGVEWILRHRLYRSDHSGEIISPEFLKFHFPIRWKYDILRCLDLFREFSIPYDERMQDALEVVQKSRKKNGRWKAASQPGRTYFVTEPDGSESRWNTLRALRVLNAYGKQPAQ